MRKQNIQSTTPKEANKVRKNREKKKLTSTVSEMFALFLFPVFLFLFVFLLGRLLGVLAFLLPRFSRPSVWCGSGWVSPSGVSRRVVWPLRSWWRRWPRVRCRLAFLALRWRSRRSFRPASRGGLPAPSPRVLAAWPSRPVPRGFSSARYRRPSL